MNLCDACGTRCETLTMQVTPTGDTYFVCDECKEKPCAVT